jgi:uncharacterized membrane protein YphA (DoxX/SURF4 family)
MILDTRRILGGFAIFSIVLLRLVIGWHFFGEGAKKIEWDGHDKQFRMVFSADDFLVQAKGPLAPLYLQHTPSEHEWRTLLASPRQNVPQSAEQIAERTAWARDYVKRQSEAKKKGEPLPVEFSPFSAVHDWATKIADDWRAAIEKFKGVAGITDEQKKAADAALNNRLTELSDYITTEEPNFADYRHELWRLANWREAPETGEVPFHDSRITAKAGETSAKAKDWVAQVRSFDEQLRGDLEGLLTSEQRTQANTTAAVEGALADPHQHNADFISTVATIVTIGVGVLLIFGFFTRLAAIVGALFLLGVILSQPFWVAGTIPTINQCVELASLLVLAGTGAGRWAGMDGCLSALFRRRRYVTVLED